MKLNLESEVFASIFQAPVLRQLLIQAAGETAENKTNSLSSWKSKPCTDNAEYEWGEGSKQAINQ